MSFKNYYAILGVSQNADNKTIKSAYRRLARKLHPDSPEFIDSSLHTFHEVDEAYEVLRDPEKRAAYDQKMAALGAVFRGGKAPKQPLRERRTRQPGEPIINMQMLWGAVGIMLTILAAFIISEFSEFRRMLEFQQDGIATQAVIIRVEVQQGQRRIVTLAYEVEGVSFFDTFTTTDRDYAIGDLVSLKYLPTDPDETVQIEDINRTLIGVIGGVLIIVGLPIFIVIGVQIQKYRRQQAQPMSAIP